MSDSRKTKILVALQVVLLGCIAIIAWKAWDADTHRAIVNMPQYYNTTVTKTYYEDLAVPESYGRATVRIRRPHDDGSGSGWAIAPDMIITNCHVTRDSDNEVVFVDRIGDNGKIETVTGYIICSDPKLDVSIVMLKPTEPMFAIFLMADKDPKWGQVAIMIGCPKSFAPVPSRGQFAYRTEADQLMISCDGFFGNSGGPVVGPDGKVAAMVCQMSTYVPEGTDRVVVMASHLFACVPHDKIKDFLERSKPAIEDFRETMKKICEKQTSASVKTERLGPG